MKVRFTRHDLEYESYAVRTHGIQVALGFLIGLFMAGFGLLLFAIGATDDFGLSGEHKDGKLTLKSTAPGLIVIGISGLIISFAVTKDFKRSFETSFKQGKEPVITAKETKVPPPKVVD